MTPSYRYSGRLIIAVAVMIHLLAGQAAHARDESIEQRLDRIEKLLASQSLVELYDRLETLQGEVQELRGVIEEQRHGIDGLKQRQRELYLDIDRRLQRLESGAVAGIPAAPVPPGATATTPSMQPPAASATPPVSPGQPVDTAGSPADEEREYRQAFNLLKEGRYQEAVVRYREFLGKYPDSGYADNAQYWLGEAHYVTRSFRIAIEEFRKVIDKYPASTKIPDAMLKIGYCYFELNERDKATRILRELQTKYPKTTAARLAENRLQRMKLEQR